MTLAKHPLSRAVALALPLAVLGLATQPLCLRAQNNPAPLSPAQFDPSDAYFQGYLKVREAESLEDKKDYAGALEKLRRANEIFATIQKYYPNWKTDTVAKRAAKTLEDTARVGPLAQKQNQANRRAVAELEGGPRTGTPNDDAPDFSTPDVLSADPNLTRSLEEAHTELNRLRDLSDQRNSISQNNESLQTQLRAAETNLESLRSRLAAAPMAKEMQALNNRVNELEQEREAMGMALKQSRTQHTEALSKIATLEADLQVMRQKYSDLQRDITSEREVASSVVAGQRRQMKDLEKKLELKDQQLAQANQRINGLVQELEQSKEAFTQLRDERDSLLRERDQMAALLNLNEAGRIQQLIEQNMGLAKNLREANETVERLSRESNADKDAQVDALRDLAIAKSQINQLLNEKRDQQERLRQLEARLRNEDSALATGTSSADPAETQLLRDIIKRQLRVQERRNQARDLLVEAAKQLGKKDDNLAKAIELFDSEDIALSPEEMKLIADRQVDGEFISPFARDRASVSAATVSLQRDITVYERTAEKAYLAGRYLPTRELFQMILDQHPGHIPSLCKLGIVYIKLNEPAEAVDSFRRATELDQQNPYAHRMLGFALMNLGDIPGSERALRTAVQLDPTDAKANMLLARACYNLGRIGEAESYFKASITADPMLSEPYYNLAVICLKDKRKEDARNYYNQALERGALPDTDLEEKLR